MFSRFSKRLRAFPKRALLINRNYTLLWLGGPRLLHLGNRHDPEFIPRHVPQWLFEQYAAARGRRPSAHRRTERDQPASYRGWGSHLCGGTACLSPVQKT